MGIVRIFFRDGLFAEIYERKLSDVNKAKAIYKQAALYSHDEKARKKAQNRLSELEMRTTPGY